MPPKKPAPKKQAAKKTAPKKSVTKKAAPAKKVAPAKKPAPKAASKPVVKPAATRSATGKASKPAARPATLWQPATVATPPRPHLPYTPPIGASAFANAGKPEDIAKLAWAYLWRSFIPTLILSLVVYFKPSLMESTFTWLGTLPPAQGYAFIAVVATVSIAYAMFVIWWLLNSSRLLFSVKLRLTPPMGSFKQLALIWFSFTWRSFLWFLLLAIIVKLLDRVFPQPSTLTSYYFSVVVVNLVIPYLSAMLSWWQLLKKRTFAWGSLELLRVKG